jgi:hypothetical protein
LNRAEIDFFNTLDKEAQLSAASIAALNVKQPDMLDELEEQAGGQTDQASAKASVAKPQKRTTVRTEKVDIEVPRDFLKKPEAHPIAIAILLKTKYNDGWVEWLPETLWEAIRRDIGAVSEINQNKIQALAVSLVTNAPWQDWPIFENCGRAFNNTIPVFGQVQPLSPAETAFTVHVLKTLNAYPFSEEVLGYISAVCLYNGIVYAPAKWFGKCQPLINKQNQNPEIRKEIQQAWKVAEKEDLLSVEFNDSKPVDVHVAKLWAVQQYLKDRAVQLKEA